jgi:hypothetical protein
MKDLSKFQQELEQIINANNVDGYTEMHDFVLAKMLTDYIVALAIAHNDERKLRDNDPQLLLMEEK